MAADRSRQWFAANAALVICFSAIVLAFKLALIARYGNATPFWDQWEAEADLLYRPWLEGSLRLQDLVAPHNEHRILTTRLLALALLELEGRVWNPILQMQVNAVLHALALSVLLIFLAKPLPFGYRVALFTFGAALFCIPYGWENTLAGFQSQFYFLLLFSFLFLWAMSAYPTGSPSWWLGVGCGVLAYLSLASGATALLAGAVALLIRRYRFKHEAVALWSVFLLIGMAATAVLLTPTVPYHAELKAQSLAQFSSALLRAAAWPENGILFGGPVLQIPLLIGLAAALWSRKVKDPVYVFGVSLAIWVAGQVTSIAFGRVTAVGAPRYTDLYAISLLLNFFVLLVLARQSAPHARYRYVIGGVLWLSLLVMVFVAWSSRYETQLQEKAAQGLRQEDNVRRYLCSGDASHLNNKQRLDIPYPSAEALKRYLDQPTIRLVLPGNIYPRNASPSRRCD
jgi:hypothetical protein